MANHCENATRPLVLRSAAIAAGVAHIIQSGLESVLMQSLETESTRNSLQK